MEARGAAATKIITRRSSATRDAEPEITMTAGYAQHRGGLASDAGWRLSMTVRTAQSNGREYGTVMAQKGTVDTREQLWHSMITQIKAQLTLWHS